MPNSASYNTTEQVCAEIKKIETNPQHESPGPAINNLPAIRGSRSSHMEGGKKGS